MKLIAHYPGGMGGSRHIGANWRENYINDRLFYSHRTTEYDRDSFPSTLHYHDYYEMVVYAQGDIHYICETEAYRPQYGDVIVIPPGQLHMSMLDADSSHYVRHVFYFYPDAFDAIGCGALTDFLRGEGMDTMTVLSPTGRRELLSLLADLDRALECDTPKENALALAYILQIFYMVGMARSQRRVGEEILPENVLAIQRYIDENFGEIVSVGDIAAHFYYSREYVSRLFKQYFNTTVADYLRTRRVAYSCTLIAEGIPLSEVCFRAGFGNLSTFIRSFRAVTGMNPSAYRALQ